MEEGRRKQRNERRSIHSRALRFGKPLASGTLRINEPLVYVRDNEPQPAAGVLGIP